MLITPPVPGSADGHVMGFSLKSRSSRSPSGKPTCVLSFYDPTQTALHRKVLQTHIDRLHTLALSDLVPLDAYVHAIDEDARLLRAIPVDDPWVPVPSGDTIDRTLDTRLAWPVQLSCHYLALLALADAPASQVAEVLAGALSVELAPLLATESTMPLLRLAANFGYSNFVRGVVQAVMATDLEPSAKLEFLHNAGGAKVPLRQALDMPSTLGEQGFLDTIAVLMDRYLDPAVPADTRRRLLCCTNAHGQSLFHTFFENGEDCAPRARAFLAPLLACDLPEVDKVAILTVSNEGDTPLSYARNGSSMALASVFAELVAGCSALSLAAKLALLTSGGAVPYDRGFDEEVLEAMREAVIAAAPSSEECDAMLAALTPC